jgi:hypothetical protein
MGPDRNVVVLADDIDILVSRMRNETDFRIAAEKVWYEVAHCELHRGNGRSATHGARRFGQPMAYRGLSQFRLTQHQHRVAIKFFAGICHSEPP